MSSLRASASTIIGRGQRDAARRDIPEMAGWTPPVGWGGAPTTGDMSSILGRARDLDENNAWVNGGLDRRVESVIGGNIRLRAQPMHRLLKRDANWRRKWSLDVQDRFRVWANDTERRCDAGQRLSFGAMAKVAYLSYMRDGDAQRSYDSGRTFHVDGDIAVIPIVGALVHRFGWLDPMCGMTGYDGIIRKLRDAVRDPGINGIWLDIDSPGGSVSGLFQLVQELAEFADEGGKPIYAWVNEMACSAAYMIASVCHRVYGPETAMVGSIGCVMAHTEVSDMLEEAGVKVTIIRSGERKMRGNQYEKLDEATLSKFQASCDTVRARFAEVVAMGRGISAESALATEADWYEGQEAVAVGLMDAVTTEREAWARLEEEIERNKRERRSAR